MKKVKAAGNSLAGIGNRGLLEARAVTAMVKAGALGVEPPATVAKIALAFKDFGPVGSSVRIAALRHGEWPAIADEKGEITYAEFDEQINRLANAFTALGMKPGDTVAILCRNHRAPLIACFAASRAGLRSLWLNTGFSPRQAREVAEREGVDLLIHDSDFEPVVEGIEPRFGRYECSVDGTIGDGFDKLVSSGNPKLPKAPKSPGRIVLLTSGTTGTPKGAPRTEPKGFVVAGSVMERMPMKSGDVTVIGPPVFHGTGLLLAIMAISLGNKLVLRPHFNPTRMLDDIADHRAATICVVPIMLQRMLELGPDELSKRDLSSLRIIFTAGSQLPADVATRAQNLFGDVIYNLYGSTEVSIATIATPADVRVAPTSVGKPALGVRIKILDANGKEMPVGKTGRIFVGATMQFEGYTGGGGKEVVDGLMSTGDVGHFDSAGRLYIDGRDDEMIVSGGENVFPREVEELLVTHPAIADAAVIGVEDPEFGQRLKAFCVLREGQSLTEQDVQAFVKENLARYKTPRDVLFLDELPRNPTGKVLKRELKLL